MPVNGGTDVRNGSFEVLAAVEGEAHLLVGGTDSCRTAAAAAAAAAAVVAGTVAAGSQGAGRGAELGSLP